MIFIVAKNFFIENDIVTVFISKGLKYYLYLIKSNLNLDCFFFDIYYCTISRVFCEVCALKNPNAPLLIFEVGLEGVTLN